MPEEPLPPPESCVHNLYRAADVSGQPEPSQLCENALGVFHMLDCPLFLGRPCMYYEAADAPRAAADDAELERAACELRRDFLGWGYTRRVRGLAHPVEEQAALLTVEPIAEPEDAGVIARRAGPEEEPEVVVAGDGPEDASDAPADDDAAPPEPAAPARPERYPGQRRSEERVRGRKKPDRASAAAGPDGEGGGDVAEPEEERPRTVEDLLEQLPEAHLPDKPLRSAAEEDRGGGRGRRSRRGRGRGRSGGSGARGKPSGDRAKKDGAARAEAGGQPSSPEKSGSGRRRRGRRGGGRTGGAPAGDGGGQRPQGDRPGGGSGSSGEAGGEGGSKKRSRRRRRRRGPPRSGGGSDAPKS